MVELLISMVVAGVIGTSIYFVFAGQNRVFFLQETIAQMQSDLRFAMETIKADVKRAGYLGTLNTWTDNFWCGNKPIPSITAIQITDGGGFVHLPAQNVNIDPDSIRLLGAFSANNTFYTQGVVGNVVTISSDPFLSPGLPTTATDWNRLFPVGSLLRIVDATNRTQIQQVTDSNFTNRTVTLLTVTRSTLMGCGPRGLGQGLLVNPVEYVRYRVISTDPGAALCANSAALLGRSTLVRENLAPDGVTVLNQIHVADYIIDMQFAFMVDTAPVGNNPSIAPDLNPYDFQGNATSASVNANPERVRSVSIFLAARTPQEDPGFPFTPRQTVNVGPNSGLGPITSFNLDTDPTSAARVRSLVSEVQLRNFGLQQRL
jgi:hypothetical protein